MSKETTSAVELSEVVEMPTLRWVWRTSIETIDRPDPTIGGTNFYVRDHVQRHYKVLQQAVRVHDVSGRYTGMRWVDVPEVTEE